MQADLAEEGPFCLLPFFLPVSYSWYLEELDNPENGVKMTEQKEKSLVLNPYYLD